MLPHPLLTLDFSTCVEKALHVAEGWNGKHVSSCRIHYSDTSANEWPC